MEDRPFIFLDDIEQRTAGRHAEREQQEIRVPARPFQAVAPSLGGATLQAKGRIDVACTFMAQFASELTECLCQIDE